MMEYKAIYDDAFLEHYGILGMKWGHRKKRESKAQYQMRKAKQKRMAMAFLGLGFSTGSSVAPLIATAATGAAVPPLAIAMTGVGLLSTAIPTFINLRKANANARGGGSGGVQSSL